MEKIFFYNYNTPLYVNFELSMRTIGKDFSFLSMVYRRKIPFFSSSIIYVLIVWTRNSKCLWFILIVIAEEFFCGFNVRRIYWTVFFFSVSSTHPLKSVANPGVCRDGGKRRDSRFDDPVTPDKGGGGRRGFGCELTAIPEVNRGVDDWKLENQRTLNRDSRGTSCPIISDPHPQPNPTNECVMIVVHEMEKTETHERYRLRFIQVVCGNTETAANTIGLSDFGADFSTFGDGR